MITSHKKAFTLVELMIVIAIIGILAAALFPSLTTYLARARDTALMTQIKNLKRTIEIYQGDNGKYPQMPTQGAGYSVNGYLRPILVPTYIQKLDLKNTDYVVGPSPYGYALRVETEVLYSGNLPSVEIFKGCKTGANAAPDYWGTIPWCTLPGE